MPIRESVAVAIEAMLHIGMLVKARPQEGLDVVGDVDEQMVSREVNTLAVTVRPNKLPISWVAPVRAMVVVVELVVMISQEVVGVVGGSVAAEEE